MKRAAVILMILSLVSLPYAVMADDEPPPPEPGTYNSAPAGNTQSDENGSDFLQSGSVQKQDNSEMLESGEVTAKPTKTPVPAAVPTEIPAEIPTAAPAPTEVPTPKPAPRPVHRPKPVKHTEYKPEPVRAQPQFPDIAVSKAAILEIVGKKTAANLFGLLSTDRNFTLTVSITNKGTTTGMYTTATLVSGHASVLTSQPEKNLGSILPGSSQDLVYPVVVLASYDGDLKLPLTLKMTANGIEKDYPVDVYIDESVPYLLYIGAGLLIFLIILMLILLFRGKKGAAKKGKDYDFNM